MSMDFDVCAEHYAAMLNHLLSKLKDLATQTLSENNAVIRSECYADDPWYSVDPLSHPDLRNMDQAQLGDLYFNPRCFRDRP